MKKYIWLIVIAGIALGTWLLLRDREKTKKWKTANITRGDIVVDVTATGSLCALTTVEVGTQVSGIISKLFADYNSEVKKGQIIALLDTSLLSASREEAYALVEKAKVQAGELKQEYDREAKLFKENVISVAEYQVAQSNYESAVNSVQSMEASLKRARINRQYAFIKAPIDGIVISRNIDVGQTVVASFNSPVLFSIANDLRKMQVYANVDEADIGQVTKDQAAWFTVDAFPSDTFAGKVNQIRLSPVIVQNVVTYIVVIDVANPDLKLLPGLTANVYFKVNESKNILKVATRALQFTPPEDVLSKFHEVSKTKDNIPRHTTIPREGDFGYLWIHRNDTIHPVKVKIGLIEGGSAEISGNIAEGDEVLIGINEENNTGTTKNPFMPSFRPNRRNP